MKNGNKNWKEQKKKRKIKTRISCDPSKGEFHAIRAVDYDSASRREALEESWRERV